MLDSETVDRAIVIGAISWPFEFWTRDGKRQIGQRRLFENDAEAERWVREHYPVEYRVGVEMRRFE